MSLGGACRVMALRGGTPLRRPGLRVWRHVGRESGAAAVSLRVLEVEAGAHAPVLLGRDCEEVLFVLEGRGRVAVDGAVADVEAETGIFVPPRARLALAAGAAGPLTLVSAQCPDPGPELRLAPPETGTAAEPSPLAVARVWERASRPSGDRWYRVLIGEAAGSLAVTQFVGAIPPGRAPDHYHEYEEVLCFLEGQGRLWAGEASAPIGPGWCAFLPRGQVHCTENTSRGELRLLGVFHPSGSPAVSYSPERPPPATT